MSDKEDQPESKPRPKKRRRWPVRLAAVALVGAVVLWFAPWLVGKTPLRQRIVPLALPKLAAKVNIGSASLGWFSSIRLYQVTIQDSAGEPLAEAPAITLDKSLISLLANTHDLGTIRLDQPRIQLALREGGSNLEDALAPYFEGESTGYKLACRVEVAQGTIELRDASGRQGRLDEITGSADYSQPAEKKLTAKISARAVSSEASQGTLSAEAAWESSSDPSIGLIGSGSAAVNADHLPLDALSPLAGRVAKSIALAGELTTNGKWEWSAGGQTQSYDIAAFDAKSVRLAAPQWIGRDELRCDALQAKGKAALEQGRLRVDGCELDSDLGSMQVSGAARVDELLKANLLAAIGDDDLRLTGRVDLARLASVLPGTLKIRAGTQITSGEVAFNVSSQSADGKRSIAGTLAASNLAAVNEGRRIVWEQPITLTLAARETESGPIVEKLTGEASFLKLSGQGSLAAGSLAANGDLSRLAAELGQFVDLDDYQLAGRLQAGLEWKQGEKSRVEGVGSVLIENFQCVIPGQRPWREPRLTAAFSAAGLLNKENALRLDSASFQLRSGTDELDASLTAAVEAPSLKTAWPVKCRLVGSLATWMPRVQVFAPLSGWAVGGAVDLNATASVSPSRVEVKQATALLTKLQVWGNGLFLYEPEMQIETQGTWDQVKGEIVSQVTTLAGTAVALRADNVALRTGKTGFSLSGDVDYRADMGQLMSWTHDPRQPATEQYSGGVTGKVKLNREGAVTRADFSANFDDLVIARPSAPAPGKPTGWQTVWSEKKVTLRGGGDYDESSDALRLSKLDLASAMLKLATAGEIAALTSNRKVDVKGEMTYDLPALAVLLRPYLGSDFQLAGRDKREFYLRGPLPDSLFTNSTSATEGAPGAGVPATAVANRTTKPAPFPPDLTGEAGLGWTSAQVQGLAIGQGELDAKLSDGVVVFKPLDLPVAEGRLKLAPRISLNSTPLLVTVEKGRVLEKVRISPEMCKTWLKYVAPLLADATRAEGQFTLDLAGGEFPLVHPEQGRTQGTLTVHQAQVGPGPLGQQAIWIANQMKALVEKRPLGAASAAGTDFLKMPDQNVAFQLVDGRVHHENLQFQVRDVTIRTKGSVGIDQSLSLVAEVPVLDRWVEKDRLLAGLKGQTLHIPITGTLSQPKLDGRAFEEVSKHLVTGAAGNLIEGQLNKSLQKLFGPKKP